MKFGLTIDPGVENGVCLFSWDDRTPMTIERVWQFPGGADGLRSWLEYNDVGVGHEGPYFGGTRLDALIVEKFTPRDNEGFSLTLESVEPLVGEGVLIGRGFKPYIQWAEPSMQYFMGSMTLPKPQKKKLARQFLALHGLLPVAKHLGRPNNHDAVSATLHTIAWFRRKRHMPTIRDLFPEA